MQIESTITSNCVCGRHDVESDREERENCISDLWIFRKRVNQTTVNRLVLFMIAQLPQGRCLMNVNSNKIHWNLFENWLQLCRVHKSSCRRDIIRSLLLILKMMEKKSGILCVYKRKEKKNSSFVNGFHTNTHTLRQSHSVYYVIKCKRWMNGIFLLSKSTIEVNLKKISNLPIFTWNSITWRM